MKKAVILMLVLSGIFSSKNFQAAAASEKFELKTTEATLTIDQKGILKVNQNNGQTIQISTSVSSLWKIVLKSNLNNKEYEFTPEKNYSISKSDDFIRLSVNSFSAVNETLPIKAEFTISVKDDAFCFSGTLKSESKEWIFKELNYPNLTGIQIKSEKTGIYWPLGLGEYYADPEAFGNKSLLYPSGEGAAMAWFSVNSPNAGLYIGNHDPSQETKVINLAYDKSTKIFKTNINTPIYSNEYSIPDIIVKAYVGEWYVAAKFYRSWYDKHFKVANSSEWTKDNSGWLLAILKQQNMEVMWPYKDIDKLCDIADQFNLGTIGLFGWGYGGHDHVYPNYTPDNLMGGREELKKAIERAHTRGKKIIIYANGKIMDTSTDFYIYNGAEAIVIQENKQPQIQYYIKQKNATPVIFAQACTGSEVWRNTMYNLALQAASFGADGILFDEVGIMGETFCFANNHNHRPGMSDAPYRLQMINEARQKAREINPDFVVMTEGTNDVIIRGIDFHHGCGVGFQLTVNQNAFPELFRYTFPELLTTQRNPNPMITRTDANFAAIYGQRHEIESRYPGDVEYLLKGTLPTAESYSNVVSPPDITKMNLVPAKEATDYVFSLIKFEQTNNDFFRYGKFIDREGIEITGKDIIAKGFINKNRTGVAVWNTNLSERRDFSVSIPGYKLVKATEPGKTEVNASLPLDANSVRLLIFEKN